MSFEEKFSFLLEAFKDQRDTIRSIDTKARFLLAVDLSFLGGLVYLLRVVNNSNFSYELSLLCYLFIATLFLCTLFSIYKLIGVIMPQENPREKIENLPKNNDISDIFFPIPELKKDKESKFDFLKYKEELLSLRDEKILHILLYEHLKLSWIRHTKIQRFKSAWEVFQILLLLISVSLLCLVILS